MVEEIIDVDAIRKGQKEYGETAIIKLIIGSLNRHNFDYINHLSDEFSLLWNDFDFIGIVVKSMRPNWLKKKIVHMQSLELNPFHLYFYPNNIVELDNARNISSFLENEVSGLQCTLKIEFDEKRNGLGE